MKLIFGLGNPGKTYEGTRHNIGFAVLDRLAERLLAGQEKLQSKGLVREIMLGDTKVLLVKPQTFMNLSGQCVREIAGFYRVIWPDVLVVADDVSIPLGKLRVRAQGTHGGHNGLRNIQDVAQTTEYPRLRVGVDAAGERDLVDHVLGRFKPHEREPIKDAVERAADAVECWLRQGIQTCMNQYNPTANPKPKKEKDPPKKENGV
ncbi:MAG: aminoacyl-tRNA hydrolase [Gemmataceae bacterium]|nr:aminoacyl-tRNA hydrolase [Gemmataceae bacterium]